MWSKQLRHGLTRALVLVLVCMTLSVSAQESGSAEEPAAIWARIADGMQLTDPARAEVRSAAKYYSRHQRQLKNTLDRSSPYRWHIVAAVEKRGMPMEIALLPAIESGFNVSAHSRRRASGLWQFVPATARLYGLSNNTDYDGRRDPIASTQAALTYLDRLHDDYGDWLLALAAYNAGNIRVAREIRTAHSRNFWALKLPKETRSYVSHLLGLSLVIAKSKDYHVQLPYIPDRALTEVIMLDRPRNLGMASQEAGVPHASIVSYNPGLRSLTNTGRQRSILLLPSDAAKLREELTRADYPADQSSPVEASAKTVAHKAKKHQVCDGDNLWVIARRYGVSVQDLKTWNHLHDNAVLKTGRQLVVAFAK